MGFAFLLLALFASIAMATVVGGFGSFAPATDEIKTIFHTDEVKAAVASQLGKESIDTLEVDEYSSQVVAGTNFKLKAKVDGAPHVVSAFRPLPHTGEPLKVTAVEKVE